MLLYAVIVRPNIDPKPSNPLSATSGYMHVPLYSQFVARFLLHSYSVYAVAPCCTSP